MKYSSEQVLYMSLFVAPSHLDYFTSKVNTKEQRIGQLFMNCLSSEDYFTLTGTMEDPFYSDKFTDVGSAIDCLQESKRRFREENHD